MYTLNSLKLSQKIQSMCSEQGKCLQGRQPSGYLEGQKNWQTETSLPLNSIQRKEVTGMYHISEKDGGVE